MRRTLIASAIAAMFAAVPMASNAAVIQLITPGGLPPAANLPVSLDTGANNLASGAITITPAGTDFIQEYTITALEALRVVNFTLTTIGGTEPNIETTTWEISGAAPNSGPTAFVFGAAPIMISSFTLAKDDIFSIMFDGTGINGPVTPSFQLQAEKIAGIPVPAAFPLLAGGMVMLGIAGRRRKRT